MTTAAGPAPIHATAVTAWVGGLWRGALLAGPSGSGKSDLALRLLARGWRLIGDDYVHVWVSAGNVYAAPVPAIAGQIEARGLGIHSLAYRPATRVAIAVDCVQSTVERMPERQTRSIMGVQLPLVALDVRPASAVETLSLAIRRL